MEDSSPRLPGVPVISVQFVDDLRHLTAGESTHHRLWHLMDDLRSQGWEISNNPEEAGKPEDDADDHNDDIDDDEKEE
jgi:hypothetical protein